MAPGHSILGVTLALLVACAADPTKTDGDSGFQVTTVVPEDDAQDVVESIQPELRLNATASSATCTSDNVILARVDSNNAVVSEISYTISFPDSGRKIRIAPDIALLPGYSYGLTVRSGSWGCTDTQNRILRPFTSRFYVP